MGQHPAPTGGPLGDIEAKLQRAVDVRVNGGEDDQTEILWELTAMFAKHVGLEVPFPAPTPRPEPVQHMVTTRDEQVRGRRGTASRCTCGWSSLWGVTDGSAEADADRHLRDNVPGYAEEKEAHYQRQRDDHDARVAARKEEMRLAIDEGSGDIQAAIEDARSEGLTTGKLPERPKPTELCHECICFLNPPCGRCENCLHLGGEIDCENDCQTCDVEHDY